MHSGMLVWLEKGILGPPCVSKHGQNISDIDAEIIGSSFEEMLQTLQR